MATAPRSSCTTGRPPTSRSQTGSISPTTSTCGPGSGGEPIDYDGTEPFKSLKDARLVGKLNACTFGIGLGPLTLADKILSAVAFDTDDCDHVFHTMVSQNNEGSVVFAGADDAAVGIPFTEANVRRLLDSEPLPPRCRRTP
ncbi:hypothetical protein [Streptomyces canus]|uniref:hypothetical protein n=1 Tax=Streptomyces canus TaxID=58343 RepID=UPI002E357D93|nr:hypothetical protein [Streptomyces canus]